MRRVTWQTELGNLSVLLRIFYSLRFLMNRVQIDDGLLRGYNFFPVRTTLMEGEGMPK